ncbi:MAG: chorismate--pyruvate lyase family protein [bacterium]
MSQLHTINFQREPHWTSPHSAQMVGCPSVLRPWLVDSGSLTKRLLDASHGDFRVEKRYQGPGMPRPTEARALHLKPRHNALIREVILFGQNQPWVFARTVVPQTTLTGRLKSLSRLDNRPLGALLFSDPSMSRGPMEIARFTDRNVMVPRPVFDLADAVWGRRSVFFLDGKPLLVNEIFLPDFVKHLLANQHSR